MAASAKRRPAARTAVVLIAIVSVLTLSNSNDILNIPREWNYSRSLSVENGETNVALGKPTSQSSDFNSWSVSSKAVDGNTDANWYRKSVTATIRSSDPWWEVDLQDSFEINLIKIHNRQDCCRFNLDGFIVRILSNGSDVWRYSHPDAEAASDVISITVPSNVNGDKVRIELPGKRKQLALTEVEVFSVTYVPPTNGGQTGQNGGSNGGGNGGVNGGASSGANVAFRKPSSQSSNFHKRALSSKAVDGDTDGNWRHQSVTATSRSSNPWWEVDLQGRYVIHFIRVYNRLDCCGHNLDGFNLNILMDNNDVWSYFHPGAAASVISITVPHVEGNKVKIELPGNRKQLALAEVEVYSVTEDKTTETPVVDGEANVALRKPSSQSSDFHKRSISSKAVDGNSLGNWRHKSISATGKSSDPWWEVDLQSSFVIHLIKIHNRKDCCGYNLDGFNVRILSNGNYVWSYVHQGTAADVISIIVPHIEGDKVKIELPGENKQLALAEVEVYSVTDDPTRIAPTPIVNTGTAVTTSAHTTVVNTGTNVALRKPSSQSSRTKLSSRVVDGNTDGHWKRKSVSATGRDSNPWWEVDLQGSFVIHLIRIYNRNDCCGVNLDSFIVRILLNGNNVWSYFHPGAAGEVISITVPPNVQGDKVKVELPGDRKQLALAEVEVYSMTTTNPY